MGLFDNKKNIVATAEFNELARFIDFSYGLTNSDKYVAKSKYLYELPKYEKTIEFFRVLDSSELLSDYCGKNGYEKKQIRKIISIYEQFETIINKHNEEFINQNLFVEKNYLDNILKDVDPNIVLDENQRRVVLTDEDYCLVIAGAGAGKTTTVAAKTKYLVDKLNIPENEILIVSFTNKAVDELRDRINNSLGIHCIISTFHSIGNAILKTQSQEGFNISRENAMYYILLDYFKKSVLINETLTKKLILFFSTYFDPVYDCVDLNDYLNELSKKNYETLRSDLNDFKEEIIDKRSKQKITINNEIVRSFQEVQIANYLYLNNIDYKYEPIYKYNIRLSNKPYTPDFVIQQGDSIAYIEHFGISQDGENALYKKEDLEKYKKAVNDKIKLHREHSTKLIYTFSKYNDGRTLLQHLDEELNKNGFKLKRKEDKEVLKRIIDTEENKYVNKLIALISRFINLFKTRGYKEDKFDEFKNSTQNVRNKLFYDICKECYLEYERKLKEANAIDFQDMINDSAALLDKMAEQGEKLHFKYVIVDEYQDISKQRCNLVSKLHKVCDAKIIAVGDDWQSIYSFSGSDIKLFLDFEKEMGYAKMLKIENTYRNSQEVIDIAGSFIQKNETQIKKSLKSPKHIDDPVIIYTYDSSAKDYKANNKSGANYNLAQSVEKCIEDIIKFNKRDKKNDKKILILGRYNFDANALEKSGLFQIMNKQGKIRCLKYPEFDIAFMTVHASKGLGFDNVIIINCINSTFGFPSKIQNDPAMNHVLYEDKTYDYAEERRLFYVAMTRTKNRVFCVAPYNYPSEFVVEINNEFKKVVKHGEWNEGNTRKDFRKVCPICGFPMQFRYKPTYGLRLHLCTNDPEICGFMTNEIKGGKMQIMKCDQCQDGYLIVKPGKNTYFLGCTNYKEDGTGCNNTISKEKYYEMSSMTPDKPIERKSKDKEKLKKERDMSLNIKENKIEIRKYNLENKKDLNDFYLVSKTILSCVNVISQKRFFGTNKILDILFGKDPSNSKIPDIKNMNEFGALSKCKREEIDTLIFTLIQLKYLIRTKEQYPVLHITNEGLNYMNNPDREKVKKAFRAFETAHVKTPY